MYKFNLSNLCYLNKFKYSYIEYNNFINKYNNFKINFVGLKNYYLKNDNFLIDNIITFKKNSGLFKNNFTYKNELIDKISFFKNNILEQNYEDNIDINDLYIFNNFEFFEKKLSIYKTNRYLLKNIFNYKFKRKMFLDKFFKKMIKLDNKNYLNILEYSIKNILLNSNFIINNKDLIFFFKNGMIYLNNKITYNKNLILKKNDVISLCYNKYYYFIYINYLDSIINNVNNFKFFKSNQNSEKIDLKKEFKFLNKVTFFKNDCPDYLEIDFLTMKIILLYTFNNSNELDYSVFINKNILLKRIYN